MRNLGKLFRTVNLCGNKSSKLLTSSQAYYCHSSWIAMDSFRSVTVPLQNQRDGFVLDIMQPRCISTSMVYCAKGKDRGGNKDKKKTKTAKLDLHELSELMDVDHLTNQMTKVVENMKLDFIKNLSLRSTSGSLEQLLVKVDNKKYQIQELAQISRKPKLIVLNIASFPNAIPHILETIQKSGLNINPQQEGTTLYLPIPKVTKEHKENLSKNAKAIYIKYRDDIKDIRNKAIKNLKKHNDVSQDTIHRVQDQVDVLCNMYIKEAEIVLQTKQNELSG